MDKLCKEIDAASSRLSITIDPQEQALVDAAVAATPKSARTYGFEDIGAQAKSALLNISALSPSRASLVSRVVILKLLIRNRPWLAADITPRVRERISEVLSWLLPWMDGSRDEERYSYPDDLFLKDYRFATGLTVPCGAQVVDLAERPGIKSLVVASLKWPVKASAMFSQDWFRPHTEARYLDEFNEAGWNRCYAEVVDLLLMRPKVVGMVATSWFYDPALETISPRLAYLRSVPRDNGAIGVPHGTTDFDIHSATATSATRRELYQEGKYCPSCWSILWLRDDMIAWKRRNWDV